MAHRGGAVRLDARPPKFPWMERSQTGSGCRGTIVLRGCPMKFLMFSAVAMLGLPVGDALAQSCTTPLSQSAVRTLVTGNYVCGSVGSDSWHELHQSTGVIRDYKKRPERPDRSEQGRRHVDGQFYGHDHLHLWNPVLHVPGRGHGEPL